MNRLEELLLLWQDQTISAAELTELKSLLASPEARAKVAEDFFVTGVVLESLRTQKAAREMLAGPDTVARPQPATAPTSRLRVLWLATAAAVLLALGGLFWFWTPPSPAVFAQFEQVQGETFVVSKEHKRPALAGQVLVRGQGIATEGADSEAVVQMEDAVRLTLGGDTMIFTTAPGDEPNAGGPRVVLEQGDLLVQATRSLKRKKMSVETPLGVAVAETEETALHVSESAGVVVVRGEVTFIHKGTGKSIPIKGGQYVVATPQGELYAAQLFSGNAAVWTTFPISGLGTTSLGYAVAFTPDGKRLAAVSRTSEGGVRLGPVDGTQPPSELRGERSLAFSPDGATLAVIDQANVVVYDTTTEKPLRVLKGIDPRSRGNCLAYSPDGKTLAAAAARITGRDTAGVIDIWDVETGTLRHTLRGHPGSITCLAFSPDSKHLASGSLDKTVVLWDIPAGQEHTRILMVPSLIVWSLAFSPDGTTLAIATGTNDYRLREPGEVKLWDVASQSVRSTLRGHGRAVTSVVYAADGQTVITGSADTTVRFWDPAKGKEYGMLKGHKAAPGFEAVVVALSPEGNWLATVSFDRTVKVWKTTWTTGDAGRRISGQARGNHGFVPSFGLALLAQR